MQPPVRTGLIALAIAGTLAGSTAAFAAAASSSSTNPNPTPSDRSSGSATTPAARNHPANCPDRGNSSGSNNSNSAFAPAGAAYGST
jgi:hypothetical protein